MKIIIIGVVLDPDWCHGASVAVAARSDMDNGGRELRVPMPDWLDDNRTPTPTRS
jgi:hypothetical protein